MNLQIADGLHRKNKQIIKDLENPISMKSNVTTEDIKNITIHYGILLSNQQMDKILKEYNRVVTDNADDWENILKKLIVKEIVE